MDPAFLVDAATGTQAGHSATVAVHASEALFAVPDEVADSRVQFIRKDGEMFVRLAEWLSDHVTVR